jgi:hypothetical protein
MSQNITHAQMSNFSHEIKYLEDQTFIYLPYLVLNFFGIVIGTIGNLIVIFTIGRDKSLRKNSAYMLMFNLALSDILISTLVHTFTNIGI